MQALLGTVQNLLVSKTMAPFVYLCMNPSASIGGTIWFFKRPDLYEQTALNIFVMYCLLLNLGLFTDNILLFFFSFFHNWSVFHNERQSLLMLQCTHWIFIIQSSTVLFCTKHPILLLYFLCFFLLAVHILCFAFFFIQLLTCLKILMGNISFKIISVLGVDMDSR